MHKKILSYLLVASMVFGSLQMGTLTVSASETIAGENQAEDNTALNGSDSSEENEENQGTGDLEIEVPDIETPQVENPEVEIPGEDILEPETPETEMPEENQEAESEDSSQDNIENDNQEEQEQEEELLPEENAEELLPEENDVLEEEEKRVEELAESTENLDELAAEYREELPDGTYYIRTALSNNKVLGVYGNSASNRTNTVIKTFEKADSHRWKVQHDEKGYITFTNEKSGKALDVYDGGESEDKKVWQYTPNNTLAQKWIARKDGDMYEIISATNGMVLDVKGGESAENTGMQIYPTNNSRAQRFQMISSDPQIPSNGENVAQGTYYLIPSGKLDKAIDIAGSSDVNKANVEISSFADKLSQMFMLEYHGGYYAVVNQYSFKALDVEAGSFMPGTNVWQYNYNGSLAQQWTIQNNEDGTYSFISVQNGMVLGVDGNNIQVQNPDESENQRFVLKKADSHMLDDLAAKNRNALADGTYYMRSALRNTSVIQPQGESAENRTDVVIHQFDHDSSQRWKVTHDEKGYVTFINEKSGKALDVYDAGRSAERKVWQYTPNNSLAQKWIAEKDGSNYKIISALNGMMLDVKSGKSADNTGLQIHASNDALAQRFQLISSDPNVEKCDEIIPSGYYYICAKADSKYALDIYDGSDANRANVWLYKANQSFAQAFDVRYKDGYYTIRNMYSNKMLDVYDASLMPSTNVWQYNDNGSEAQKWSVKDNGDGSYTFISVGSGMALDIYGGEIKSGSNVQVYTPNGSNAQKFVLKKAEPFYAGWYTIYSAANNTYAMEIAGGNTANKTNIQLYSSNKTESQKWNVIKNSDGTFRFENSKSKKVMDVYDGKAYEGNIVWAYTYNGTAAQKWNIEKLPDGTWRIVSAINKDYVLAPASGNVANKTKIVVQKWKDSKSQKWIFKKTTPVKRIYQNPSQYYQIQDSITLKGGGYNLSYGYEGVKVMKVIQKLGLGNGIGMNGAFYSRSVESAVKRFQKKHGLRQTGVVDLTTWQKMGYTKTQWEQWGAYVSPLKVSIDSTRSEHIEAMISTAYSYLGTPYVIGASGPPGTGIDCSGLVMQALYSAGIDTSPINPVRHARPGYEYESRNMWKSSKFKRVPYSQRQRGDLIFYQNSAGVVIHVAIYLGNNKVIESWPNKVVVWPVKNGSRSNIKGVVRPFV